MRAPDTPSYTSPGAEGWKDVLQPLKEQSVKMEKLARALSVIQQGILRKNQAVGQRADVKSLVTKRSLEVRYLDETVTREEVVAALCIALGKPDLGDQCRLYKRSGGVQTAVVCLIEAELEA